LTLLLGCACVALAAWTLLHNRLGNFNIRPLPKTGGRLVTSGPYQWIRHPMYTTVLLGGGALALVPSPALGGAVWATLALVLWVKSIVEERWLSERYATYRDYAAASKRFVPLVF
jgi:protein-S-isoprenylcysteine O-methyltransferase Ste14